MIGVELRGSRLADLHLPFDLDGASVLYIPSPGMEFSFSRILRQRAWIVSGWRSASMDSLPTGGPASSLAAQADTGQTLGIARQFRQGFHRLFAVSNWRIATARMMWMGASSRRRCLPESVDRATTAALAVASKIWFSTSATNAAFSSTDRFPAGSPSRHDPV